MSKFVDGERDQVFLLPPDLRDWIPEDDLAHFVIAAAGRLETIVRLTGATPLDDKPVIAQSGPDVGALDRAAIPV